MGGMSATETGRSEGRRETGDLGGEKCALGKIGCWTLNNLNPILNNFATGSHNDSIKSLF